MTDSSTKPIIAGAILAGGRASRMGGVPKGALENSRGVSIVGHLINEFRLAGILQIVILANDPHPYQKYGVEIIPDSRTGIGPIGGIEAGLRHLAGQCDGVMFVPCDMPNITAKELLTLKEAFIHSDAKIVSAETGPFFWHPLCAVVHNDMAPPIISAIDRGQRKIQELWRQLGADRVKFAEKAAFININSFLDVNRWRENRDEKKSAC
jgi:molybdopterin-guanine dinucleotide biosynthesis protein A